MTEPSDAEPAEPSESPELPEPPESPLPGGLGERERGVLALERRSWPGPGAKERAIREELGMAPTRYYQLLNVLLDEEAALAHDPVTVNRLRRLRAAQRAHR